MANGTITNLFTGKNSYAALSTVNVPLTGTTPLVIDGYTVATNDNLMLSNQTTPSQIGGYNCVITGGNYTLSLISGQSLNTGTTYNGGQPFDFQVLQGSANNGAWNYYDNGTAGVFNQYQTSSNDLIFETKTATVTLAGGASTTVTFSAFANTYVSFAALIPSAAQSSNATFLQFGNPTAQSLTSVTYNVLNTSSTPITAATVNLMIIGKV